METKEPRDEEAIEGGLSKGFPMQGAQGQEDGTLYTINQLVN